MGSDIYNNIIIRSIIQSIVMKRIKATNIAVHVIGASHKEKLAQILRNNKFSLFTDETTDICCIKTACVVVRYNDTNKKKIVSEFWELYKIYEQFIQAMLTKVQQQKIYSMT